MAELELKIKDLLLHGRSDAAVSIFRKHALVLVSELEQGLLSEVQLKEKVEPIYQLFIPYLKDKSITNDKWDFFIEAVDMCTSGQKVDIKELKRLAQEL